MGNDSKRPYRRDEYQPQQYVAPQDLTASSSRAFGPARPPTNTTRPYQDPILQGSPIQMNAYGQVPTQSSLSSSSNPSRMSWNSMTTRASSTPSRMPASTAMYGAPSQSAGFMDPMAGSTAYSSPMGMTERANLNPNFLPPPMSYAQSPYDLPRRSTSYPYPASSRTFDVTSAPQGGPVETGGTSTHQRQKPKCFEHGCNGREFSTFSNLLRHQRERSGTAAKSYCPRCGAEFTRSTARTNHLMHSKCKPQRGSSAD